MVNLQETIYYLTSDVHVVQLEVGASVHAQKYFVLAGLLTQILNAYKKYKESKHCGYSKSKRDTVR